MWVAQSYCKYTPNYQSSEAEVSSAGTRDRHNHGRPRPGPRPTISASSAAASIFLGVKFLFPGPGPPCHATVDVLDDAVAHHEPSFLCHRGEGREGVECAERHTHPRGCARRTLLGVWGVCVNLACFSKQTLWLWRVGPVVTCVTDCHQLEQPARCLRAYR
jgi:hypothetical protein